MPRRDWNTNTAHTQKPHHKRMHSAARGEGLDRKLKAAKRQNRDSYPHYHTPVMPAVTGRTHSEG